MKLLAFKERSGKYVLTFLVWNNILGLFITLALNQNSDMSFLANLACILVVSHVTALVCLAATDLFEPLIKKLFKVDESNKFLLFFGPLSISLVPGLVAGFYASLLVADFFAINWHPNLGKILKPGIVFGVIVVLLNFLYYKWVYSVRAYFQKELELKTAQANLFESKLQVLMSELNPHLLFNTLSTVIEVLRSNSARAENILLALCDYYQSVLVAFDNTSITLAQEIEISKKYIDLQKKNYLNMELTVPALDNGMSAFRVPPLILQPLIENSLKHGFSTTPKDDLKKIKITALKVDDRIHIKVFDNGKGVSKSVSGKSHSLGLRNSEQRLRWLSGTSCKISLSSGAQGTTVTLDIPYENPIKS